MKVKDIWSLKQTDFLWSLSIDKLFTIIFSLDLQQSELCAQFTYLEWRINNKVYTASNVSTNKPDL